MGLVNIPVLLTLVLPPMTALMPTHVPHRTLEATIPQELHPPSTSAATRSLTSTPSWLLTKWLHALSWPWACLAWFESTDEPSAVNAVSGDGGLWQIAPTSWREFGGTTFAPVAQDATPQAQLTVAERIAQGQGWQAWETAPLCGA